MYIPPENAEYGLVNSIQNAVVLVFKRNCLMLCILFSGGLLLSTVPRGPLSLSERDCSQFFSSAAQDSRKGCVNCNGALPPPSMGIWVVGMFSPTQVRLYSPYAHPLTAPSPLGSRNTQTSSAHSSVSRGL